MIVQHEKGKGFFFKKKQQKTVSVQIIEVKVKMMVQHVKGKG